MANDSDSIPDKLNEKAFKDAEKKVDEFAKRGKIILLNIKDDVQRYELMNEAKRVWRSYRAAKGRASIQIQLKEIDCLGKKEQEIINELQIYISRINVLALLIYNLRSSVYEDNNDIAALLLTLKERFNHQPFVAILIHFHNCKVPDKFREDFQGEYEEIAPLPEPQQKDEVDQGEKEAVVGPAVETYIEEQNVSYPISVKVYCIPGFQGLEYQGEKAKLENIWLRLLKFLWKKKGALATRNEIRKELWGENEEGKDAQITNIIGRLRKAFKGIGFKKETVKQQIITTRSDTFTDHGRGGGGYRFLRGIVLLDFHY